MEVSLPCDVFSILLDMKVVPGHLAESLRSVLFFKEKSWLCWVLVAMRRLFTAACGLSPAAASRVYFLLAVASLVSEHRL